MWLENRGVEGPAPILLDLMGDGREFRFYFNVTRSHQRVVPPPCLSSPQVLDGFLFHFLQVSEAPFSEALPDHCS